MDQPSPDTPQHDVSKPAVAPVTALGIGVIVFGVYLLVREFGVYIPGFAYVRQIWERAGWPLAVMAIGVAIIVATRRPSFRMPDAGARLTRSTEDRMLAGVFGGIARHFGMDPTLVRLAYVALAIVTDAGAAIVAYVVLAIIVPKSPKEPGEPSP